MKRSHEISQVCYVCRDLERAVDYFIDHEGVGPFYAIAMQPESVRYEYRGEPVTGISTNRVAFGYRGRLQFEIAETDNPVFTHVLGGREIAFHHRIQMTETFDADFRRYCDAGISIMASAEMQGSRIQFMDTFSTLGHYTELVNYHEVTNYSRAMGQDRTMFDLFDIMIAAARNWDGRERLRDFSDLYL